MVLRKTTLVLSVLLISGCAAGPSVVDQEKVRTFASIYRKSKEAREVEVSKDPVITLRPDAGYDAPYFPVYESGRVEKVWVPAHVARDDKDILVAGHWVFVMIERPHWYIEDHGMDKVIVPVITPTLPSKE